MLSPTIRHHLGLVRRDGAGANGGFPSTRLVNKMDEKVGFIDAAGKDLYNKKLARTHFFSGFTIY